MQYTGIIYNGDMSSSKIIENKALLDTLSETLLIKYIPLPLFIACYFCFCLMLLVSPLILRRQWRLLSNTKLLSLGEGATFFAGKIPLIPKNPYKPPQSWTWSEGLTVICFQWITKRGKESGEKDQIDSFFGKCPEQTNWSGKMPREVCISLLASWWWYVGCRR